MKTLGKIIATAFISSSLLGAIKVADCIDSDDSKRNSQQTYHSSMFSTRNLGYKIFFGLCALAVSGGIVSGIANPSASSSDYSEREERDPCKDDPGAFGPGGSRY